MQCDAQCRQEFWEKIETCKPATPPPEVVDLLRVRIGPLWLGDLPEGKWRALTPAERDALIKQSKGN